MPAPMPSSSSTNGNTFANCEDQVRDWCVYMKLLDKDTKGGVVLGL